MDYSTKLRNLRIQRGLSQMEMAKLFNTSQSSITSWECGRREPDFSTLKRLAAFFGVPLSAILPSDDNVNEDYVNAVSEFLSQNPKLKELFDYVKFLSNEDIETVLSVARALNAKHGD